MKGGGDIQFPIPHVNIGDRGQYSVKLSRRMKGQGGGGAKVPGASSFYSRYVIHRLRGKGEMSQGVLAIQTKEQRFPYH